MCWNGWSAIFRIWLSPLAAGRDKNIVLPLIFSGIHFPLIQFLQVNLFFKTDFRLMLLLFKGICTSQKPKSVSSRGWWTVAGWHDSSHWHMYSIDCVGSGREMYYHSKSIKEIQYRLIPYAVLMSLGGLPCTWLRGRASAWKSHGVFPILPYFWTSKIGFQWEEH